MDEILNQIKFPIGLYEPKPYSEELKLQWLQDIQTFPDVLKKAVQGLSETQLQTPYRDGAWTVQQIVHQLTDANLNGYLRCKFAYTETDPLVRPFNQDLWVQTPENRDFPVHSSLQLLENLHLRRYSFLSLLNRSDWDRTVIHPEYKEKLSLWRLLGLYSWHPRHHAAQIVNFRKRMNW